jgi:hypothetical protein
MKKPVAVTGIFMVTTNYAGNQYMLNVNVTGRVVVRGTPFTISGSNFIALAAAIACSVRP